MLVQPPLHEQGLIQQRLLQELLMKVPLKRVT
jgi:hypothetical protein